MHASSQAGSHVQAEGFSIEVLSRKRRSLSSTDAYDVDECARKFLQLPHFCFLFVDDEALPLAQTSL